MGRSKALTSVEKRSRSLVVGILAATGITFVMASRNCTRPSRQQEPRWLDVDASAYEHSESKSDQGGKFLGCPFDEDNESDQSEGRAKAWVSQIKNEGMPL